MRADWNNGFYSLIPHYIAGMELILGNHAKVKTFCELAS